MKSERLEILVDRWVTDASFREAVRADVTTAVARSGMVLTEEEWEAVRAVDWSADDEELTPLFSNFMI